MALATAQAALRSIRRFLGLGVYTVAIVLAWRSKPQIPTRSVRKRRW